MKDLGAAIQAALYEVTTDGDPDFLRNHPGNSGTHLRSASWRLAKHHSLARLTASDFEEIERLVSSEYGKVQSLCESPIERDMLAALMAGNWHACKNPFIPVHNVRDKHAGVRDVPVIIIPQFQYARYRLDFAILCRGEKGPRILDIECDGAEFHDAGADKERDDYLTAFGVTVFRASGHSIHAHPYEIADLAIDAAQRLLG